MNCSQYPVVMLTLSDSKHVVLPVDDDSDLNVVAAFDRRGEYIYTGNAKGKVRPVFYQVFFIYIYCSYTICFCVCTVICSYTLFQ